MILLLRFALLNINRVSFLYYNYRCYDCLQLLAQNKIWIVLFFLNNYQIIRIQKQIFSNKRFCI